MQYRKILRRLCGYRFNILAGIVLPLRLIPQPVSLGNSAKMRKSTWSSRLALVLALSLGAFSIAWGANTIHVPGDQATIQAAINAAANGDTVVVAPGTYHENINFIGKAITVTSSGGPSVTTIDGGSTTSVVKFISGEGLADRSWHAPEHAL